MKKLLNIVTGAAIVLALFSCTKEAEEKKEDPVFYIQVEDAVEIPYEGGIQPISVHSNTEWTVHSEVPWMVINSDHGSMDAEITLEVAPNEGEEERSAIVIFQSGEIADTLNVFQHWSGITTGILDEQGTANCFIVRPGKDRYSFQTIIPINGNETVSGISLVWQDRKELIKSIDYVSQDRKVFFTLGQNEGNAVIAAKNGEGKIVWSWHLWVSDYDPEAHLLETSKNVNGHSWIFMDRNLGALSSNQKNFNSLGLIYQWGRKDPFTGVTSEDEKECERYDMEGNVLPAFPEDVREQGTVELSIQNPNIFYKISYKTNDWTSPSDDDLWGGVSFTKTAYDPCPAGWRIPICDEKGASPYEFIKDGNAVWEEEIPSGYTYKDFWFPCGGTRVYESGTLSYLIGGAYGGMWIGTAGKASADQETYPQLYGQYLFVIDGRFFKTTKDARSQGMSVRCVKE